MLPRPDSRFPQLRRQRKPLAGLDAWVFKLYGKQYRRRELAEVLARLTAQVEQCAGAFKDLTDEDLQARLQTFHQQFRRQPGHPELPVNEALAGVGEAVCRRLGVRPSAVQIMGAQAVYHGLLAEMARGEGKVLTAGIAAVLAGWTGHPCHVLTANDFLAQRDATWLGPLFSFCGLTAGLVIPSMTLEQRAASYLCDITYSTARLVATDYLRDRSIVESRFQLSPRPASRPPTPARLLPAGLQTAIVDEADYVLIDDANASVTLTERAENPALLEGVRLAKEIAATMQSGVDYRADPVTRDLEILEAGWQKIEAQAGRLPPLFRNQERAEEILLEALGARDLFQNKKQYMVHEGRVYMIDESTGRLLPGRSMRPGLHQAIEAKEGLELSSPVVILDQCSLLHFFLTYKRLSGLSHTARESTNELWLFYHLPVVCLPASLASRRQIHPDRFFPTAEAKWKAVADEIRQVHAAGRPVLVTTRKISYLMQLAKDLRADKIAFQAVNAMPPQNEVKVLSQAGQGDRITLVNNSPCRGIDIAVPAEVAARGGLHLLATEHAESRRNDRQWFDRCGLHGQPGSVQVFVSLEDDLFKRLRFPSLQRWLKLALVQRWPGIQSLLIRLVARAQLKAEKAATRMRRILLRKDTWLDFSLPAGEDTDRPL